MTYQVYTLYYKQTPVYVGYSKNYLRRFSDHSKDSNKPWFKDIDKFIIEVFHDHETAIHRERELISFISPIYNVIHNENNPNRRLGFSLKDEEVFKDVISGVIPAEEVSKKYKITEKKLWNIIHRWIEIKSTENDGWMCVQFPIFDSPIKDL